MCVWHQLHVKKVRVLQSPSPVSTMDQLRCQQRLCVRGLRGSRWIPVLLVLLQWYCCVASALRMTAHTPRTPALSPPSSLSPSPSSSTPSSLAFVASTAPSRLQPRTATTAGAVTHVATSATSGPAGALSRAAVAAASPSSLAGGSAAPPRLATAKTISPPGYSGAAAASSSAAAATAKQVGEGEATSMTGEAALLARPASLAGKIAFVAGVGDSNGYGWAIARELAAAGARVAVGTWPPVLSLFKKSLESGKFDADRVLPDQTLLQFQEIYPLDAAFDTPADVPQDVKENKRYAGVDGFTISEVAENVKRDLGGIDILVHSLANGPEVANPLLKTSRKGYLAALSNSSYSMVSLLQHFAPIMKPGGSALTLSYIASEKVVPGYGGGMSSAKAALESDTRTLAWEAGQRFGVRVNAISAGPLRSRAAQAIQKEGERFIDYAVEYSLNNAPLKRHLHSDDVAAAALFLLSPMARAVTGVTLYVDNGLHAMGHAVDSRSLPQSQQSTS